ncbi:hypothetical protein Pla175_23640 [Pirellulimonas nuda]|uniref:PcfJ-like protein n=1 Tax=Pirellulimonas nuda TaxID=2528009 RepID=A0A518DBZ2_9BACT|nr:PcfJ domain-containing protein [Pirellulimonas nuda]QDU88980.1 hypothetical protein Pla175_23640 [Pirellulimonas nuda]
MRPKKQATAVEPDRELLIHIGKLGLGSVESYRAWCAEHGFGQKLNKHWKTRCRERYFAAENAARARLRSKKQETRNPLATVKDICAGRLREGDVTQPQLLRFCQAIQVRKKGPLNERRVPRPELLRLLTHLDGCRTKFFDNAPVAPRLGFIEGNTYLEALVLVAIHARGWLRPVERWKPTTRNVGRQFSSLLRHLFARYDDLPAFFDGVWFAGRGEAAAEHRRWYVHVGGGRSIRDCKLPIPCTKKMAHHFMRAPGDLSVPHALQWGQVRALGGDDRLARAVLGTRLAESFEHQAFWATVLRWFIAHPMLDRAHIGPIVDFLHHQKFVPERVFIAPGRREESPPPQPHLTMKGRTPESLLRQVNRWHGRLAHDNSLQLRQWAPCGIEAFEFTEGALSGGNLRVWTIRELLGSKALMAEGRQMKHCVATYASSCARGHCSIWTMEVESFQGTSKALTIEVRSNTLTICQARGKLNRLPTEKELGVLARWASCVGLKVAGYLGAR